MQRRRLIRVPASSANLGPGYDTFAAAVALHLEVEVEETGTFAVETDLDVPKDRSNLIVRSFERLHSADGFTFRVSTDVPLNGGLGSSASAIVAGLVAADSIFELDAPLLEHATAIEGHPDNVAAALRGGFVVCADGDAVRFDPPPELEAVVVIPHEAVRTEAARAAMPASVPIEDAVYNTAHGALLMLGLAQNDWDLVARGLRDRLHQPHRAHLYPRSMALIDEVNALGALGATISGAGPTVLVWSRYEQTGAIFEALRRSCDGWADVLRAPFEPMGADIREL